MKKGEKFILQLTVTKPSSIHLTIMSAKNASGLAIQDVQMGVYLQSDTHPNFGAFQSVRRILRVRQSTVFKDGIMSGDWYLLFYNGGDDLMNMFIKLNIEGKSTYVTLGST